MSVLERMLQVLRNRDDAANSGRLRRPLSRRGSQAMRAVSRDQGSCFEGLEQRQVMAISTYVTPPLVTIVAEPGDDVFLQQVATNEQSLYVADNSSFQGRTVVGGPAIQAGSPGAVKNQLLPGANVNTAIDQILITSGSRRIETVPQNFQGFPMIRPGVTRYGLSGPGLDLSREISGTLSLVQSDGRTERWTFTNGGSGAPVFTSGLGVTRTAGPDDVYPRRSMRAVDSGSNQIYARSGLEIDWNVPSLGRIPVMDTVTWFQNHSVASGNRTEFNVGLAAPASSAFIGLPNATGPGLNPIITSSFSAEILLDGQTFRLTTDQNGTLYFNGQQRPVWDRVVRTFTSGTGAGQTTTTVVVFEMSASGRLWDGSRQDVSTKEYPRGIEVSTSGAVAMRILSAEYAVAAGGDPVTATVFAGQDITAGLNVNLLSPGSAINIDSPVRVPSTRQALGVSLRASTVSVNAPTTVETALAKASDGKTSATVLRSGRIDVGSAVGVNQLGFETARGIVEVADVKDENGKQSKGVTAVLMRTGFAGAGYDPARPPLVTLDAPRNVTARASVLGIVNGSVVPPITILNAGAGYEAGPPNVVISAPEEPGGVTAQAVALVDPTTKTVVDIRLQNGGSGYRTAPSVRLQTPFGGKGAGATASATITGSLSNDFIFVEEGGFGYEPNQTIPITIQGTGSGAAGVALADASGRVSSIQLTNGGAGYDPQTVKIVIADPAPSTGVRATAEAEIDPATSRVSRIKITNPGSGYGQIPDVTIAPPLAATPVGRVVSVVSGGELQSVNFAGGTGLKVTVSGVSPLGQVLAGSVGFNDGGQGYAIGDVVTIDSTGSGRSAQFRILQVTASGGVERLEPISGGRGYVVNETIAHDGTTSKGIGYGSAPRVFVSRPDDPNGRQAVVEATLGEGSTSIKEFKVIDGGSGYSRAPLITVAGLLSLATAETASFNAAVGADVYDIDLADDPFTDNPRAGLLVSQSGSLVSDRVTVPGAGLAARRASAVRVEVHQGDILVEGTINAADQSYFMQSGVEDQRLAPFRFSTETNSSNVQTGMIMGANVAVTLANDMPTPLDGAVAYNDVSLRTDVDSLRVRAARAAGQGLLQPFPYRLSIDEQSSLAVDALAASSFPIEFRAKGNLTFNAALSTAGGFSIIAEDLLTVNAPVTTTFGQIALSGKGLDIRASLRVTDEPSDDARQDIVLDATAGAITLRGGEIAAPGRVVIRQKAGRVPKSFSYQTTGARSFYSGRTLSVPISVADNFVFDELAIGVTLAVTNPAYKTAILTPLSGLSASLESPNGEQFELFASGALSGTAVTNAVFTPAATAGTGGSKEPYSGVFRPASANAIEQLFNRSSSRGAWRLNLTAANQWVLQDTQIGVLSATALTLRNPVGGLQGDVYGSSRIVADSLLIDAEGAVGNGAVQPSDNEYYLQTDVTTVEGTAGGAFALADANQVNVVTLRADGLVSLRANGVDLPDGTAALKATLLDLPALDVSAMNGSIDVDVTTSSPLSLGNSKLLSLAAPFRTGLSSMSAAGNVRIRVGGGSQGGDIIVLDAPLAGSSSRAVRFVIDQSLSSATYTAGVPGTFPDVIESKQNGAIGGLFAGRPALSLGEKILVAGGVNGAGNRANGIYTVQRSGGASTKWRLVRASDADTLRELPTRSFVKVNEGPRAGQFYQVVHEMVDPLRFGLDPIALQPLDVVTNIGSDDPGDLVSFVVSTTDGRNTSPGSLGKMISLRQQNDTASVDASPDQAMDFVFANDISGPIQLAQELPLISKAFAIDGRRRLGLAPLARPVIVDGSRIVTSRTGRAVGPTSVIDGFVFASSSGGATADSAAAIANVIVGGFARGAAIKVDGAQNVRISAATIGLDDQGARLSNQKSVVVTSAVPGGANGVTIADSVIAGGAIAGLSIEGQAGGVQVYGTKIGAPNASNAVGVAVSSVGKNAIGDPALGRNFISNNGVGMTLSGGAVTMLNTQVSGNSGDGIRISSGQHTIGRIMKPQPRDGYSNEIFGNGGFGLSMTAAATRSQKVIGNLLGVAGLNRRGNVAINGVVAGTGTGYTPNGKTGVDANENQHLTASSSTTPGTPGPGRPVPRPPAKPVRFPWRARR